MPHLTNSDREETHDRVVVGLNPSTKGILGRFISGIKNATRLWLEKTENKRKRVIRYYSDDVVQVVWSRGHRFAIKPDD